MEAAREREEEPEAPLEPLQGNSGVGIVRAWGGFRLCCANGTGKGGRGSVRGKRFGFLLRLPQFAAERACGLYNAYATMTRCIALSHSGEKKR